MKSLYEGRFHAVNGKLVCSSGISWRKRKKQRKMELKKDNSIIFFLSDDNFFKAISVWENSSSADRVIEAKVLRSYAIDLRDFRQVKKLL
jgi:GTP cyclohydrolase III